MGVKAVLPTKRFKPQDVLKAFDEVMDAVGRRAQQDFKRTGNAFGSVTFPLRRTRGKKRLTFTVEIGGGSRDNWNRVDRGSGPHAIVARNAKALRFMSLYVAGTKPNTWATQRPRAGGDVVFRRKVWHPGVEPRRWRQLALETYRPILRQEALKALRAVTAPWRL